MKKRTDIRIGQRAAQEAIRICGDFARAGKMIGSERKTVYHWEQGVAPSAIYLARLHELGADVTWILTGRKT